MFDKKTAEEEKPFGETGIPKQLRANPEVDAAPGAGQGIAAAEISVALANHPSQENIVWTDPDPRSLLHDRIGLLPSDVLPIR